MIDPPDNNHVLGQPSSDTPLSSSPEAHRCEDAPSLIMQVLEGVPNPQLIQAVRVHFGSCFQCQNALDLEIRFKLAMAQRATDKAPPSLQLRISESLQRIDLKDITVSDL
jgi:hypothetical protein